MERGICVYCKKQISYRGIVVETDEGSWHWRCYKYHGGKNMNEKIGGGADVVEEEKN